MSIFLKLLFIQSRNMIQQSEKAVAELHLQNRKVFSFESFI